MNILKTPFMPLILVTYICVSIPDTLFKNSLITGKCKTLLISFVWMMTEQNYTCNPELLPSLGETNRDMSLNAKN